jgi:hypothetical protein
MRALAVRASMRNGVKRVQSTLPLEVYRLRPGSEMVFMVVSLVQGVSLES